MTVQDELKQLYGEPQAFTVPTQLTEHIAFNFMDVLNQILAGAYQAFNLIWDWLMTAEGVVVAVIVIFVVIIAIKT